MIVIHILLSVSTILYFLFFIVREIQKDKMSREAQQRFMNELLQRYQHPKFSVSEYLERIESLFKSLDSQKKEVDTNIVLWWGNEKVSNYDIDSKESAEYQFIKESYEV